MSAKPRRKRLILSTCFTLLNAAITIAQDCSRVPILLAAEDQPRFFHTPGYESGQYPSSAECHWLLMARGPHRRLMLTVHDSQIDDALFSRCDDYCSIRDGNTNSSNELIRWCGDSAPFEVVSSSDALYVTFRSDDSFQARGINISFSDFEVPGCPPAWMQGGGSELCYSLRMRGRTWPEAQRDCALSRSNLVTFQSSQEYTSFAGVYSKNKSFPWIGYSDAADEGVFVPIDPSETRWPEEFPNFGGEHPYRDCVYLDWNVKEGPAYALDDCRNKHEYVCKRKLDGSTIPYPPPSEAVRRGLAAAPFNFTVWLFILVVLLLLLLILYLCYYKCKEKRASSRVGSMDANQRLVSGLEPAPGSALPPSERTQAITATTVATVGHTVETPLRAPNFETNARHQMLEQEKATSVDAAMGLGARPLGTEKTTDSWTVGRNNTLPPLTTITANARDETLARMRRGQLFERPRVDVLDNVSAISLDEFWSKNDPAMHRK